MRSIKGQFVMRHNDKPASFGTLKLKLVSEEQELEDIVPVGEAVERLLIPVSEKEREEWRARQESSMTPEQIAVEEAEVFKPEYRIPFSREIPLDIEGSVPPGTQVVGNDELSGDTYYLAVVTVPQHLCGAFATECFKAKIRITGDAIVDLHEAIIREPEPEIIPPTARELELKAEERIVRDGTLRLGKKSHLGFAVGPIDLPVALTESVEVPSGGTFGFYGVNLSSSRLVNRVSVWVEQTSSQGRDDLLIAIYNTNGSKVVETKIDLGKPGSTTGIFPSEVTLPEGDYFVAWKARDYWHGRLRGFAPQLDLMNAAGAPVAGFGQSSDRETLPPTLGGFAAKIARTPLGLIERPAKPIFAVFKA